MIVDNLKNIDKYSQIPKFVIDFIKNLSNDIKLGRYELEDNSYVNVETYDTKSINNAKFEIHKKYVDIQILLSGKEKIYIEQADKLSMPLEYNEQKDIRFYNDNVDNSDYITLNGSNFVMIYPHEAHAPQIAIDNIPKTVKKVVVKLFL